jgi:hypothetical protein
VGQNIVFIYYLRYITLRRASAVAAFDVDDAAA